MPLKPLQEQTIVITGGTSGNGLATAKMAAKRGAHVIVVARDKEGLEKVCEEMRSDGGRADYVVADVGNRDEVRAAVDGIVERHGGFDTWFNNAGVGVYSKLEELSDEDHERLMKTNYWGVVYGSTEALRHLRERGGALINMGSISSEMPAPVLSSYTATKFAVKGFTDSLRLELMHDNAPVSVTLIQPSGIHTPFGSHAKNNMEYASKVPPPVYAPELVAQAVLHAAEHPSRSMMIGGAGRMMTWAARLFPSATDPLFARMFFRTALDRPRPPRDSKGLHEPGTAGELYGDQRSYMRKTSVFTSWQMHPARMIAGAAAGAIAGAATAAFLMKPRAQGAQRPSAAPTGNAPAAMRRVQGM